MFMVLETLINVKKRIPAGSVLIHETDFLGFRILNKRKNKEYQLDLFFIHETDFSECSWFQKS